MGKKQIFKKNKANKFIVIIKDIKYQWSRSILKNQGKWNNESTLWHIKIKLQNTKDKGKQPKRKDNVTTK